MAGLANFSEPNSSSERAVHSKYLFKENKNLHTWLVDEGHLQNFIVCAKFAFDHLQKIVATKL